MGITYDSQTRDNLSMTIRRTWRSIESEGRTKNLTRILDTSSDLNLKPFTFQLQRNGRGEEYLERHVEENSDVVHVRQERRKKRFFSSEVRPSVDHNKIYLHTLRKKYLKINKHFFG